jgi:hypothetical protein
MSVIEIDLVRFTTGAHHGDYGVMIDDDHDITILSLWDGERLISWNVIGFHLEPDEWSDETREVNRWLDANQYKFVYPPTRRIKAQVLEFVEHFRQLGPVEVFTHARKAAGHSIVVVGVMVIIADLLLG